MYQKRKTIEKGMLMLVDAICLAISLVAAFHIRYSVFMGISRSGDQVWLIPLTLVIQVIASMVFDFNHHF